MSLQPLTAAGVTAKTTELYALSTSLLNAQADLVEADFQDWIKDNFTLTTAQTTYLTNMDSHAANYFGGQCGVAFRAKRPITLDPGTVVVGYAKWTGSDSTLKVIVNSAGVIETTGSLAFKMEYRP